MSYQLGLAQQKSRHAWCVFGGAWGVFEEQNEGFFFGRTMEERKKFYRMAPAIPTATNTVINVEKHARRTCEVRLFSRCVVRPRRVHKDSRRTLSNNKEIRQPYTQPHTHTPKQQPWCHGVVGGGVRSAREVNANEALPSGHFHFFHQRFFCKIAALGLLGLWAIYYLLSIIFDAVFCTVHAVTTYNSLFGLQPHKSFSLNENGEWGHLG